MSGPLASEVIVFDALQLFLTGYIKSAVYWCAQHMTNVDELKQPITAAVSVTPEMR
jgi:hypothetical protein